MNYVVAGNIITKFYNRLKETGEKLSREEKFNRIYKYLQDFEKKNAEATNKTLKKLDVDPDSFETEYSIPIENDTIEIRTLPENERESRKKLQDQMLKCFINSSIDIHEETDKLPTETLPHGIVRNTQAFFGCNIKVENLEFNGVNTYNILNDKNKTKEEKINAVKNYINEVDKVALKLLKKPAGDKDLIEKANIYHSLGTFYSVQTFTDMCSQIGGVEFPSELDTKFKNICAVRLKALDYFTAKFSLITDPLYPKMDEKTIYDMGQKMSDNFLYESVDFRKLAVKHQIDDLDEYFENNEPAAQGYRGAKSAMLYTPGDQNIHGQYVKDALDLTENDSYFDQQGNQIPFNELNNHMRDGNLSVIKENGKAYTVLPDSFGFISIEEYTKTPNYKDEYKKMFDSLESGASLTKKPSTEYENMRRILGDLINYGGTVEDQIESLNQFKQNAKTYLDNYKKKFRKSTVAVARKDCVETACTKLDEMINTLSSAKIIGPIKEQIDAEKELNEAYERSEKQHAQDIEKIDENIKNFDLPEKPKQVNNEYENFKNSLLYDAKVFEQINASYNNETILPSDVKKMYEAKHRVNAGTDLFVQNVIKNTDVNKIVDFCKNDQKFGGYVYDFLASNNVPSFNEPGFKEEFLSAPLEAHLHYLNQALPNINENSIEKFKENLFKNYVTKHCISGKYEDTKKVFDSVEKLNKDISKVDNIVPAKDDYDHVMNIGDKADLPLMDAEINNLKNTLKDNEQEFKNTLDEAGKILVRQNADRPYLGVNDPVEKMGGASSRQLTEHAFNYYKSHSYYKKDGFDLSDTHKSIHLVIPKLNNEQKSKMFTDTLDERIIPDKSSVEKFKKLHKMFKESGITFDKKFLEGNGNIVGAETWISPIQKQLANAISEGKKDEITNLVGQYKNFEKKTDEMYRQIKMMNNSEIFPENNNSDRNPNLPAKYRNDVIGTSRFNGFTMFEGYCQRYGFDAEKLIEDPIKYFSEYSKTLIKDAQKKANEVLKEKSTSDSVVRYMLGVDSKDDVSKAYADARKAFTALNKLPDLMAPLYGERMQKDLFAQGNLLAEAFVDFSNEMDDITKYKAGSKSSEEFIKNLILVEKEDIDFFKLHPDREKYFDLDTFEEKEPFDRSAYYETKTSAAGVASRAVDVFTTFETAEKNDGANYKNQKNLCVDAFKFIPETDVTPSINTVREALKQDKLKNVTPQILKNLENENKLAKLAKGDITRDQVKDVMDLLVTAEKTYKNRSSSSKRNNQFVKNEQRFIDSMYDQLSNKFNKTKDDLKNTVSLAISGKNNEYEQSIQELKNRVPEKEIEKPVNNKEKEVVNLNAGVKGYQEFKEEVIDNYKKYAQLKRKEDDLTPSKYTEFVKHNYHRQNALVNFHRNFSNSLSWKEIAQSMPDNKKFSDEIVDIFNSGSYRFKTFLEGNNEEKAKKVDDFKKLTLDEQINFVEKEAENYKKDIPSIKQFLVDKYIVKNPRYENPLGINEFFDFVDQNYKINENIIPDKSSYAHPIELGEKTDAHFGDKLIDDVLSIDVKDDDKVVQSLNECKDILVQGKDNVWSFTEDAEHIGDSATKYLTAETIKHVQRQDYFDNDNIKLSKSKKDVEININLSSENKSAILLEASQTKVNISQDTKNKLRNIIKKYNDANINIDSVFIDQVKEGRIIEANPNACGAEIWVLETTDALQKKISEYGNLKKEILARKEKEANNEPIDKNAPTQKELEEKLSKAGKDITALKDKYQKYDRDTQEIIKDLNELNPTDLIAGNCSSARDKAIPHQYREDILGTSKFNSLTYLMGMSKRHNLNVEDFINDPIGTFDKECRNIFKNELLDNVRNEDKQKSLSELMFDYTDEDALEARESKIDRQSIKLNNFLKVGEYLPFLYGKENIQQMYNQVELISKTYSAMESLLDPAKMYFGKEKDAIPHLKRFMLVEPEDRDIFKLSKYGDKAVDFDTYEPQKPFNDWEYYRTKTSPQAYLLRAFEVRRNFTSNEEFRGSRAKNEIIGFCKDVANFIPNKDKTPGMVEICKLINDNHVNYNDPATKEKVSKLVETVGLESNLLKAKRNGITSENVADVMSSLAKIQKTYNDRGLLSKWFNTNVGAEKKLIDDMYQKVSKDTGVPVANLKRTIENKINDRNVQFEGEVNAIRNNLANKENNINPLTNENIQENPNINNVIEDEAYMQAQNPYFNNNRQNIIMDINEQNNIVNNNNVQVQQEQNVIVNNNIINHEPHIGQNGQVIMDDLRDKNNIGEQSVNSNEDNKVNQNEKEEDVKVSGE